MKAEPHDRHGRFTDRFLRSLRATGKEFEINDSAGFGVRVSPAGSITFQLRYRRDGKKQRLSLGTYPLTSLKAARERAHDAARLLDAGTDPIKHARELEQSRRAAQSAQETAERMQSVRDLADEWMARYVSVERKRPDHVRQLLYGSPRNPAAGLLHELGTLCIDDVTRRDIVRALDRIVDRGARVQANRAASLLKQMFQYGVERGLLERNVCADIRRRTVGGSERNLSPGEIRLVWIALNDLSQRKPRERNPAPGRKLGADEKKAAWLSRSLAIALQLLLLTAQRRGELVKARWEHVDLDTMLWTIPAENSKNGRAHAVPLSKAAVNLFGELKTFAGDSAYVLPAAGLQEAITERAVTKAASRARSAINVAHWVPHDLRRTAATQLSELGVAPHVVEKILNHTMQGVMAVYNRHTYFNECRKALDIWANRIEVIVAGGANVVPIHRGDRTRREATADLSRPSLRA